MHNVHTESLVHTSGNGSTAETRRKLCRSLRIHFFQKRRLKIGCEEVKCVQMARNWVQFRNCVNTAMNPWNRSVVNYPCSSGAPFQCIKRKNVNEHLETKHNLHYI